MEGMMKILASKYESEEDIRNSMKVLMKSISYKSISDYDNEEISGTIDMLLSKIESITIEDINKQKLVSCGPIKNNIKMISDNIDGFNMIVNKYEKRILRLKKWLINLLSDGLRNCDDDEVLTKKIMPLIDRINTISYLPVKDSQYIRINKNKLMMYSFVVVSVGVIIYMMYGRKN
jgi:hypothetical protein